MVETNTSQKDLREIREKESNKKGSLGVYEQNIEKKCNVVWYYVDILFLIYNSDIKNPRLSPCVIIIIFLQFENEIEDETVGWLSFDVDTHTDKHIFINNSLKLNVLYWMRHQE